jgi:hypothetical protein
MARRRGLSCKDVLACLDVLSDVDSEYEEDIEGSFSWDVPTPSQMKCQIPTVKYVHVNQIRKRSGIVAVVKFLEKTDMCVHRSQKQSKEHQCEILSKRNKDRNGMDVKQTHP